VEAPAVTIIQRSFTILRIFLATLVMSFPAFLVAAAADLREADAEAATGDLIFGITLMSPSGMLFLAPRLK